MVNGNTAPYRELDNIRIVHEQEERYRVESLALIEGEESRRSQLHLVELALSLLVYFTHDYEAKTEDEFTIQRLGIRLFNAGSSAVKLGLSGYYQVAFSLARDIMETGFLLDYLRTAPQDIARWRDLSDREHWKSFRPELIRKRLEERDRSGANGGAAPYKALSRLASHPTAGGFAMTRKGGEAHVGPFISEAFIDGFLREMVMRLVPAAWVFSLHFPAVPKELTAFQEVFGAKIINLVRTWDAQPPP
jgi:hypothetical protein